jgi:hypothetical protein
VRKKPSLRPHKEEADELGLEEGFAEDEVWE